MAVLQTWDEIVANTLRFNKTIRESLQDAIYNVAPADTPILSRVRQVGVNHFFVQWLEDTYRAAQTNAQLEAMAFTAQTKTVPNRTSNIAQIFYVGGMISDTQRQVEHAGMADPLAYYEAKDVIELKKDIELALVRGSAVTGDTNTARQMNGLLNIISTNKTSISGITFTEKVFNDLIQLTWDVTREMPTEVYCSPYVRRTISLYSTKVTPFIPAERKEQILAVDTYQNDFGRFRALLHRELNNGFSSVNELFAIRPEHLATGWLQPLRREILARDGLRVRYQISCDLTLLYRSEKPFFAADKVFPYLP